MTRTGRPRKRTASPLPKYVELKGNWYRWKPYLGRGKFAESIKLCPAGSPMPEIWRQFELAAKSESRVLLVKDVFAEFFKSPDFRRLKPGTQKKYHANSASICGFPLRDGRQFGNVEHESLTPGVIRRWMDKRGLQGEVAANRDLAFFSRAFSWAYERELVTCNPCKGITRFKESARDLYVEDWQYELATSLFSDLLVAAMEIAYLCRAREIELCNLNERHIKPEGLQLVRAKNSKPQIIGWTPRLRAAVELARSTRGRRHASSADQTKRNLTSMYLFTTQKGDRLTEEGFRTLWGKAMRTAIADGKFPAEARFTFHDLKAKGCSDFEGDEMDAAGHKTRKAAAVYQRKEKLVPSTK